MNSSGHNSRIKGSQPGVRRVDPYAYLAGAVLVKAVRDAKRGDADARLWLASEDAEPWLELVDLSHDAGRRLVKSGKFKTQARKPQAKNNVTVSLLESLLAWLNLFVQLVSFINSLLNNNQNLKGVENHD